MSYLLSHLINRINDVKIRIKQLEKIREKTFSKIQYERLENEIHFQRYLLDEFILIYQLALEEE